MHTQVNDIMTKVKLPWLSGITNASYLYLGRKTGISRWPEPVCLYPLPGSTVVQTCSLQVTEDNFAMKKSNICKNKDKKQNHL